MKLYVLLDVESCCNSQSNRRLATNYVLVAITGHTWRFLAMFSRRIATIIMTARTKSCALDPLPTHLERVLWQLQPSPVLLIHCQLISKESFDSSNQVLCSWSIANSSRKNTLTAAAKSCALDSLPIHLERVLWQLQPSPVLLIHCQLISKEYFDSSNQVLCSWSIANSSRNSTFTAPTKSCALDSLPTHHERVLWQLQPSPVLLIHCQLIPKEYFDSSNQVLCSWFIANSSRKSTLTAPTKSCALDSLPTHLERVLWQL